MLGGPSAEREISLKSGKAVASALRRKGLKVIEIGKDEEITAGLNSQRIDIAFIALHGRFGEDGQIQALLEKKGIPYTGSGVEASRLALNKSSSRKIFRRAGLSVPPYRTYGPGDKPSLPPFDFPLVLKPFREGSSIGLSIVNSAREYEEAWNRAREHDREIIVERYIPGTEMTVGILDGKALPVIKIVPKTRFFDYGAKYTKGMTDFILPAPLPKAIYRKVQEAALKAHQVLGCYAYSRADLILSPENVPYVLEVNTIPGFTETSLFPQAARAAGIEFPQLCLKLLKMARRRFDEKRKKNQN